MQLAEKRAFVADTKLPRVRWTRYLVPILALGYLAIVLLTPLVGLVAAVWDAGLGRALHALTGPGAIEALTMTGILVVISVLVNGIVGTAAGIVLVRQRFRGREWLNALFDLPIAISPVMIGLGFLLLVGRQGVFGELLNSIDLKVTFAFPGLVIGTLFVTLPYTVREVGYVLEEVGTSEEDAAATLGASPWQTFWRVTLPNIRTGLSYGLLMTVARSVGEFGAVLVLGGSISGRTQTASTFIHDAIEERQPAEAYGMALLLSVVSVVLLLLLEWSKKKRGSYSHGHRR
jgi:sulfate/thiosulfate transport system permease protein